MSDGRTVPGKKGFAKGVSGNPTGQSRFKVLSDALRMEFVQDPKRARRIADKLITLAEEGDLQATALIFDRLEGRAVQSIEIDQSVTHRTPEEVDRRIQELTSRLGLVIDVTPEAQTSAGFQRTGSQIPTAGRDSTEPSTLQILGPAGSRT